MKEDIQCKTSLPHIEDTKQEIHLAWAVVIACFSISIMGYVALSPSMSFESPITTAPIILSESRDDSDELTDLADRENLAREKEKNETSWTPIIKELEDILKRLDTLEGGF